MLELDIYRREDGRAWQLHGHPFAIFGWCRAGVMNQQQTDGAWLKQTARQAYCSRRLGTNHQSYVLPFVTS